MNIADYIHRATGNKCVLEDRIFIKQNTWLSLKDVQLSAISIESIKKSDDTVSFQVYFQGNLFLKIGISRPAYSFSWIYEKTLESADWQEHTVQLDLSRFENGTLEINFLALEDSAILLNDVENIAPSTIADEQILYSFLSPTYELCCEEPLYYKFNGASAYYSFECGTVHLGKDTSVDLMTYFNSFSACKWSKYTNISSLSAYIDFCGEADVYIIHKDATSQKSIASFSVSAAERSTFELPIGAYPEAGILGVQIRARKESVLYGGGWLSPDPEVQQVRLGIGITTFKREDAVKAAVARLGKAIAAHPLYSNDIDITVVDNGQTLTPEDVPAAELVLNRNLGGTGGFTRSLVKYQESGKHTHCLFMDDDASCEAGAIFRSMSFIRHATDPKTSLSGAMLFENIQFLQWENGAWFDGGCHPLKHDFDMRDPNRLVENEAEPDKRIYGAWWFFFFPLAEAKNYSLPFFVRGDDIDFSYSNDFKVLSMNGVSCWQQDFKTKESAMTVYLFLRSHMVHHMTIPFLEQSYMKVMKILWGHFWTYNSSYFYGTAACVNLAMKHVMKGPKFWEDNIVPTNVLKQIKELSACEAASPYTEAEQKEMIFADRNIRVPLFPKLLRKITLNGHLLPKCMIRKTPKDMIFKWMTPNRNRVFMRDQVIMLDELTRRKTMLKRDPAHYFSNLGEFLALSAKLYLNFKSLRTQYTKGEKEQRTREFWKKQFGE